MCLSYCSVRKILIDTDQNCYRCPIRLSKPDDANCYNCRYYNNDGTCANTQTNIPYNEWCCHHNVGTLIFKERLILVNKEQVDTWEKRRGGVPYLLDYFGIDIGVTNTGDLYYIPTDILSVPAVWGEASCDSLDDDDDEDGEDDEGGFLINNFDIYFPWEEGQ